MVSALLQQLVSDCLASRIWQRDSSAFVPADAPGSVHDDVRNRLGWLDAPTGMPAHLADLSAFRAGVQADGLTHVYLLGMGGSSLCAEVLRDVPLPRTGSTRLTVLDTTDERAVRDVTSALSPSRAFFIVASKSGSTIEVASLERHFWSVVADSEPSPGRHFAAITDPGTTLVGLAAERGYRRTFLNPPDIGGRYAALSLFGLVPAALLGLDVRALLISAAQMADRCHPDDLDNPGLALGAFMSAHALAGRDKLTILASHPLAPLGAWIEQLVAESTGKQGRGILPVVDEPVAPGARYANDRTFVAVVTPEDTSTEAAAADCEAAGHPVLRLRVDAEDLGAEFFRWEFATAVAGAALSVNPFDEPNVRDAKVRTQAHLDARKTTGRFRIEPPLTAGADYLRREHRATGAVADDRYVALLDYLPASPHRAEIVRRVRAHLRERLGVATTHGIGPRYLHSTGQYHKGGPNTGRFLLLTAADATTTPVPGTDYTFSTLKEAQALGDFDALVAAGRDVVHCHVEDPHLDPSAALEKAVRELE